MQRHILLGHRKKGEEKFIKVGVDFLKLVFTPCSHYGAWSQKKKKNNGKRF